MKFGEQHYSDQLKKKVVSSLENGSSPTEIAATLNIARSQYIDGETGQKQELSGVHQEAGKTCFVIGSNKHDSRVLAESCIELWIRK